MTEEDRADAYGKGRAKRTIAMEVFALKAAVRAHLARLRGETVSVATADTAAELARLVGEGGG